MNVYVHKKSLFSLTFNYLIWVISGYRRVVYENCALLDYYAAWNR